MLPVSRADSDLGRRARQDSISGSRSSPVSAASDAYHISQVSKCVVMLLKPRLTSR